MVLAAANPAGHPEHPFAVAMIELFEGLIVAGIDSGDQLLVGGLAGWVLGYQGGGRGSLG